MDSTLIPERRLYVARWTIAGALFGAFFPLIAWRVAIADAGVMTFGELHALNPTMWIVDLAPTVLGIAGAAIGVLFARLSDSKLRTEAVAREIAQRWTSELHSANLELAESLEARRSFYAAVTHELRSPLTAIVGYTDLAEDLVPQPPELTGYLAEIYGAATAMIGMVNDLLDAAKLETSGIAIEMAPVACDEAIHEVVQRMTPLAQQKDLRLSAYAPDRIECWADPVRLGQVLTNLIANAIKFSKSGVIEVHAAEMNGVPTVEVRDRGVGMSPEHLETIFDAYDSGPNGSGRRDSSGLGLAISRSLVEAMDGTISARSDGPGHGSTFVITLQSPDGQVDASRRAKLAV